MDDNMQGGDGRNSGLPDDTLDDGFDDGDGFLKDGFPEDGFPEDGFPEGAIAENGFQGDGSQEGGPNRRRGWIVAVAAAVVVAAIVALVTPMVRNARENREEERQAALAACESAVAEFTTLHVTYTTTLSSAKKLAQGDGTTFNEESATKLITKVDHLDDAGTISRAQGFACEAGAGTDDLNEAAWRYGAANSAMINRMRDVQTDTDSLRLSVNAALQSNQRELLQSRLTYAKSVYDRSSGKAADALRGALAAQIDAAGAMLSGDGAANEAIARQAAALQQAAADVVAGMPLDCELSECVALTFDDGPNKELTPQLLAALDKAGVKATFFVQGQYVSGSNTGLLKRMADAGHEIGTIGWRHTQLHEFGAPKLAKWFADTDAVITQAGVAKPTLFRPPDGAWSGTLADAAAADGQSVILWDTDSRDWDPQASVNAIASNVVDGAHAGSIVALHDGDERTIAALPQIVSGLQERGYHLVTVSQLLVDELQPGTVFYGRGDTVPGQ